MKKFPYKYRINRRYDIYERKYFYYIQKINLWKISFYLSTLIFYIANLDYFFLEVGDLKYIFFFLQILNIINLFTDRYTDISKIELGITNIFSDLSMARIFLTKYKKFAKEKNTYL